MAKKIDFSLHISFFASGLGSIMKGTKFVVLGVQVKLCFKFSKISHSFVTFNTSLKLTDI